ncbi:hypothetical protein BDY24DRAFT_374453 [Mrakia frigida]|uniref:uncharacterized protein n=1 Tax=Mrakia frigida TaxID=29902 RepID=UPI003FCC0619
MESSQIKYILKDVAPKLISPNPVERNAALNAYLTSHARQSSPWTSVEGITKIKEVYEAWGAWKVGGKVKSVDWDADNSIATILSKQTYSIPIIHLLQFTTHSKLTLHLNQEDDEPLLLITAIEESSGVGALLSSLPLIPSLLPKILTPLFLFLGAILLGHSHHVAQLSTLSINRPTSPSQALFHPFATVKSLVAIAILSSFAVVGWFVGLWQSKVGDALVLSFDFDFERPPPSPSTTSNPKKRAHSSDTSTPAEPTPKQPRYQPASAPDLPVEGESYASAVKDHSDKNNGTNGTTHVEEEEEEDETTPEAAKEENLQENPTPGESYAAAVVDGKDGEATSTDKGEQEQEEVHGGEGEKISPAEAAVVKEGVSFADAVKE